MTSVFIGNQGPDAIEIVDGSGLKHSMGVGANNVFALPVTIHKFGGEVADQNVPAGGPVDESGALPPGDSTPDTEFDADNPPPTIGAVLATDEPVRLISNEAAFATRDGLPVPAGSIALLSDSARDLPTEAGGTGAAVVAGADFGVGDASVIFLHSDPGVELGARQEEPAAV